MLSCLRDVGLTQQLVDIDQLARSLAGRAKSLGAKDGIPAASAVIQWDREREDIA